MLDSSQSKSTSHAHREVNNTIGDTRPHCETQSIPQSLLQCTSPINVQLDNGCLDKTLKKCPINSINKFKCYTHNAPKSYDVIKDGEPEVDCLNGNHERSDVDRKCRPQKETQVNKMENVHIKSNRGFSIDAILERPCSDVTKISDEERRIKIDVDDDEDDQDCGDDNDDGGDDNDTNDKSSKPPEGGHRIFENVLRDNLPFNPHHPKIQPLPYVGGNRNAAILSAAMFYRFLAKSKYQDFTLFHKNFPSFPNFNLPTQHSPLITQRFDALHFGGRTNFWNKNHGATGKDENVDHLEQFYKNSHFSHHHQQQLISYKEGSIQSTTVTSRNQGGALDGWQQDVSKEKRNFESSREASPSSIRRTGSGEDEDDEDGFVDVDCGNDDADSILNHEISKGHSETNHKAGQQDRLHDNKSSNPLPWPAWVYCTRYSDRPSSGPRSRKCRRKERCPTTDEKRPRTAFTGDQLGRLKREFTDNKYLTEERRTTLARELNLNESQIKIWFQNKRAKMKKASGVKNTLALQLMAQGLYNHSSSSSLSSSSSSSSSSSAVPSAMTVTSSNQSLNISAKLANNNGSSTNNINNNKNNNGVGSHGNVLYASHHRHHYHPTYPHLSTNHSHHHQNHVGSFSGQISPIMNVTD